MTQLYYSEFESAFGTTLASSDGQALCNIWFPGQKHEPDYKAWQRNDQLPLFLRLQLQLAEYAEGQRTQFDLPMAPRGTDFQTQVWQALLEIPFGEHTSYGTLAQKLQRPSAARAVGAAVGRNPLSILVPCHRVLGSSGQLTGFASGLDMKKRLLRIEGQL